MKSALDESLIDGVRHAYLIGIGGVGMSALARVLKHLGLKVSGSDSKENHTTRQLGTEGIRVYIGQKEVSFADADLIIYSSAISPDHIEFKAAKEYGLKICHRAQVLSSLLNQAKTSVAITGTHGKTTTSSMLSFVLSELGKNPTCLVGGDVLNLGTNTVLGNPDLWVSEVDESDKTHELYAPNYTIVTNLEVDHIDHYRDLEDLKTSFSKFLAQTRDPGLIVYYDDDVALREVVQRSGKAAQSFGFTITADISAQNVRMSDFGSEFDLFEYGFYSGRVRLSVPGMHNIANAMAAIAVLLQLGLDLDEISKSLVNFRGAKRRLEIKCQTKDYVVIDDYAHHPTEVRASIRALRSMGKKITVVFQPHRFSRTQYFFKQFGHAFEGADELILTEIYGAGERNVDNISVDCIYNEVLAAGHPHVKVVEKRRIMDYLLQEAQTDRIIAFLGAGDIGEIADELANRFKSPTAA